MFAGTASPRGRISDFLESLTPAAEGKRELSPDTRDAKSWLTGSISCGPSRNAREWRENKPGRNRRRPESPRAAREKQAARRRSPNVVAKMFT
jgi:hypothetical protein